MTETAAFTYIAWQDKYRYEKPYQLFSAVADDATPVSNLVFEDGTPEMIADVRGHEHEFTLDKQGFTFHKHNMPWSKFDSVEWVENEYFTELADILNSHIDDVQKICFFDWRIRKNVETTKAIIDASDRLQHFLPARHVHIDQTPSAVVGRMFLHLPDDADKLLEGRVRVINLWRPLVDVVEDRPLAICDLRTVDQDDVVDADHVRKHYSGSNYYLKASSKYKWYYLSCQKRDEVTLLQMFDSAKNGVSGKGDLASSYSIKDTDTV